MTSPQTASIEARPGPISIDPRETAVIVVDMQNDFGSEGGLFARAVERYTSAFEVRADEIYGTRAPAFWAA